MTNSGISGAASLMVESPMSGGRRETGLANGAFQMFLGQNMVQANPNPAEKENFNEQTQVMYDREKNNVSFKDMKISNAGSKNEHSQTEEVIVEKVEEFSEKVRDILQNELGVTEEELIQAMEILGIGFTDLMDPSNLTSLVMELAGTAEAGSLLISEEFQVIYGEMGKLTRELLTELGMAPEEFETVLQQITAEIPAPVSEQEQKVGMIEPERPRGTEGSEGQEAEPSAVHKPESSVVHKPESSVIHKPEGSIVHEPEDPVVHEPEGLVEQEPLKGQEAAVKKEAGYVQEIRQDDQDKTVHMSGEAETGTEENLNQNPKKEGSLFTQEQEQGQLRNQAVVQDIRTIQAQDGTEMTQVVQKVYVDVEDIMRQVTQFTKIHISQAESTIEMQLNPVHLGKLYLQVASRNGIITAHLAAQNEAVKEVLEGQAAILKENMNQQGLKVEAVEVTVASHGFEQNLEGNQGSHDRQGQPGENQEKAKRNLRLDTLEELEGNLSEEESLAAKIMKDNGNRVDLNA